MAAYIQTSPNTATTLGLLGNTATGKLANVRQLWKKGALLAEQNEDFFQQMEGRSEKSLIWAQEDLAKGEGSIMNFTTQAGFYGRGKKGDSLFETSTDYETIRQGNFQLKIDFLRNAVRTNKRMEEIMGMKGDIESGVNVELGKWLGRQKTTQVFAMFKHKLPAENVLYAGGKTRDTIKTADIFRWDEAVTAGHTLLPMGGLPANIAQRGAKSPIYSQTFVSSTTALLSFKLDTAWKQVLRDGDVRGMNNTIFEGGYPSVDGHTIVPYTAINHDGVGPMGSFINPLAYVGNAALAAGTTARVVYGGGNATDHADADFFEYFDNAPFTFIDTGAVTPTTDTRYFLIYNLTGAAAGKWGMYAYTTGNDGNKITCTAHLGAAATGVQVTTLGGVVYNAALNTTDHPLGSMIIPCNSYGVPIGSTLVMARSAILRGYGSLRADHTMDELNGKFITDRYITSIFGQSFKYDRKDRVIGALRIDHAISYPGISLPTVS
jgi:hypothetical protein